MAAEFSVATLWRIGRRNRNEDRYGEAASRDGRRRVWAVADGVGGHPGGEVAAETAMGALLAYVRDSEPDEPIADAVRHGLEAAQAAIADVCRQGGANAGMATTIALAISDGEQIGWGHVGDSRIYRVRDGAAARLTRDHSVVEALRALAGRAEDDEQLPDHGGVLLSSLGQNEPTYDVSEVEQLRPDDAYLICSDGLWAHFSTKTIAAELRDAASLQDWLDRLGQLVERAADPRQDNFTAIAFRAAASAA
jgi:serine/threonine protein phosphatase PrpC